MKWTNTTGKDDTQSECCVSLLCENDIILSTLHIFRHWDFSVIPKISLRTLFMHFCLSWYLGSTQLRENYNPGARHKLRHWSLVPYGYADVLQSSIASAALARTKDPLGTPAGYVTEKVSTVHCVSKSSHFISAEYLQKIDFLISQGSVAICLRWGVWCHIGFVAHFMRFPEVQRLWKSVNIWQSYSEFNGGNFFETQCMAKTHDSSFRCHAL